MRVCALVLGLMMSLGASANGSHMGGSKMHEAKLNADRQQHDAAKPQREIRHYHSFRAVAFKPS
ncbi:hypothetical protein GCM10023333_11600 [Ferrimonas pelagia]|uniref:Uncharacterized protein n=1 Tax=Ferrimonas pelagia TaxID=1177826 RepID=A0ABP9EIK1_9GAMM